MYGACCSCSNCSGVDCTGDAQEAQRASRQSSCRRAAAPASRDLPSSSAMLYKVMSAVVLHPCTRRRFLLPSHILAGPRSRASEGQQQLALRSVSEPYSCAALPGTRGKFFLDVLHHGICKNNFALCL